MRTTVSRKEFAEWVEQRLIDDKWFTIEFYDILNSFETGKTQYIQRLPISTKLLVTSILSKINIYPVKATSFDDHMKYILTGEWVDVDTLPESVRQALPTIYAPKKTTVPPSVW